MNTFITVPAVPSISMRPGPPAVDIDSRDGRKTTKVMLCSYRTFNRCLKMHININVLMVISKRSIYDLSGLKLCGYIIYVMTTRGSQITSIAKQLAFT